MSWREMQFFFFRLWQKCCSFLFYHETWPGRGHRSHRITEEDTSALVPAYTAETRQKSINMSPWCKIHSVHFIHQQCFVCPLVLLTTHSKIALIKHSAQVQPLKAHTISHVAVEINIPGVIFSIGFIIQFTETWFGKAMKMELVSDLKPSYFQNKEVSFSSLFAWVLNHFN